MTTAGFDYATKKICAAQLPPKGLHILSDFSGTVVEGVLDSYHIVLPPFTRGCYFSADGQGWPSDANRVLPWILKGDLAGLYRESYVQNPAVRPPKREALFSVFQLTDNRYLALLPLASPETMSWLWISNEGELYVRVGTLGTGSVTGDIPLIVWAVSGELYDACRVAWQQALASPWSSNQTPLRAEKPYPEAFTYLGWCSWEQYKRDISSDLLCEAIRQLDAYDVPVRWVLVDDGHQTEKERMLKSFVPDKDKFPDEWAPLMAMRSQDSIRWLGLWHCFQGLWKNIHPENDLGALKEHLMRLADGSLVPRDDPQSAEAFYDALIGSAKEYGFDFCKIDVQATNLAQYRRTENAVRASTANAQALERACRRDMSGLINCMAHNSVCVFNTRHSAVTRCSIDYKLGKDAMAKSHIQQSFNNTVWMGHTVWPDHDMFHSSDPVCGRMMAISKALSGAPIYLSDAPEDIVPDVVHPLCFRDGALLRPLSPAVPLPDSVFVDALNEPVAYRVIAPLANQCAAIATYCLTIPSPTQPVDVSITVQDYTYASVMLQPYTGLWKAPQEGLIVYDWIHGTGQVLTSPYRTQMTGFSDRLFLLAPIRHGWSVVGRIDKYLCPAAVDEIDFRETELRVRMRESGPLVVWSTGKEAIQSDYPVQNIGNGLWRINPPMGINDLTIALER